MYRQNTYYSKYNHLRVPGKTHQEKYHRYPPNTHYNYNQYETHSAGNRLNSSLAIQNESNYQIDENIIIPQPKIILSSEEEPKIRIVTISKSKQKKKKKPKSSPAPLNKSRTIENSNIKTKHPQGAKIQNNVWEEIQPYYCGIISDTNISDEDKMSALKNTLHYYSYLDDEHKIPKRGTYCHYLKKSFFDCKIVGGFSIGGGKIFLHMAAGSKGGKKYVWKIRRPDYFIFTRNPDAPKTKSTKSKNYHVMLEDLDESNNMSINNLISKWKNEGVFKELPKNF